MEQNKQPQTPVQPEDMLQVTKPKRKPFHGFSMGFLLILLAVLVALYIVCTMLAA